MFAFVGIILYLIAGNMHGTVGTSGNCDSFSREVKKYDWNTTTAMNVISAESSCNPEALNADDQHTGCNGSYGLFQIACVHSNNTSELYDPTINIQTAYKVYTTQGWNAWGVCTDGRAGVCNN